MTANIWSNRYVYIYVANNIMNLGYLADVVKK